jgi:two-component sensor histidine kinase
MDYIKKPRISIKQRLGGKWLASWASWFLFIPFSFITTLNYDGSRDFKDSTQLYLLAVIVQLSTGLAFFVAHKTIIRKRKIETQSLWKVILVFTFAGFIRIVTADFFSDYFVGQNEPLQLRIVSVPAFIITFATITIILDFIDREFEELKRLNTELRMMNHVRTESLKNLSYYQNELLKCVTFQIIPAITQLEKMYFNLIESNKVTSKELLSFSETVKEWNQTIIRAISHLKYDEGNNLLNSNFDKEDFSISIPSSIRINNLTKTWNFFPSVIWLPYFAISFILSYIYMGLEVSLIVTAIVWLANFIFIFSQRWLRPNLPKYTSRKRLIFITWPYAIYGLFLEITFLILLPVNSQTAIAIWVYFLPLWALLGMFVSGVIYGVTGEGGRIQAKTVSEIIECRKAAGAALESIRRIQKIFTDTVHGRIQSTLTAAALLLENTSQQNQSQFISKETLAKVTDQLEPIANVAREDLRKLTEWTEAKPKNIENICSEIINTWMGIIKIDTNIDSISKNILNSNDWLRSAFEDVVNESISNAVRHGNADMISITAQLDQSLNELKILISNNGRPIVDSSDKSGIGFSTLRALGVDLEFSNSNQQTLLTVTVPLVFNEAKEKSLV